MDSLYPYDLACGGRDEQHPAGLAFVVGVHTSVSLLVALVLERLVLASGHWSLPDTDQVLAFGGRLADGGERN